VHELWLPLLLVGLAVPQPHLCMLCCPPPPPPPPPLQEDSLVQLCVLGELRRLEVGNNQVAAVEPLEPLLRGLPRLMALDLKGNLVCKLSK
jgi:hypothetical protein